MEQVRKRNWWKVVAIVLVIVFVCCLALQGCGKVLENIANSPSVPNNYYKTVKTNGTLEAKYMAMGEHEVEYLESYAAMSFEKYEIHYPADIANMDGPLPVVIFVNGTGCIGTKYMALQKHMASWGFITVATDEKHAWNGFSAEMCVRFLQRLNTLKVFNKKDNALYDKIDVDNIGVTGHSQGGYGVVNAITDQHHAASYKAAVSLSSCPSMDDCDFMWTADPSQIKIPFLIIGSTGPIDAVIASMEGLQRFYDSIPDGVDKVLTRRNGADHGQMLYYADGYVTAWFMYYLQGNTEAGNAFFGENAEILTNPLYQDQKSNQYQSSQHD